MTPTVEAGTNFTPLFEPKTVAVAGMSATRQGPVNRFVSQLRTFGYTGAIYAVHPTATEIDGTPAYRTFASMPEEIDYAFIAVPARSVPDLLQGAEGNVRFAQVMTSGFSEISGGGKELQERLVEAAEIGRVRVIGPNCLGTYSPRGRMTFVRGASKTPGTVGVISQSGGLGVDLVRRGAQRGLAFSSLVTIGNSADVDATEILEHYLNDNSTQVIGLYLEDIANGQRLFELLSAARGVKPCVLLKGGMSAQGNRAAASHTGALVSNARIWSAMAKQSGTIMVETLDEFINMLTCLQHIAIQKGHVTDNVVLAGNGGGTSVLGCDSFNREQLGVPLMDDRTVANLEALELPAGTSVINPIDTPAGTVLQRDGQIMRDILEIATKDSKTKAVVAHMNLPVLLTSTDDPDLLAKNIMESISHAASGTPYGKHFVAVLRSDGAKLIDHYRRTMAQQLSAKGVAVVYEISEAARVLRGIRELESSLAIHS